MTLTNDRQTKTGKTTIAVIAFDGISPFHLSIPGVVFAEAIERRGEFELLLCSADPQPLATNMGYQIDGLSGLENAYLADIIIVPSWRNIEEPAPKPLLTLLRQAYDGGSTIVGLCLGAFVLAQAGLLSARQATTHWEYAERLARQYPEVQVCPDSLYVDDGRIMTSAGTAAGLDACLQILRGKIGATAANQVARRLVIPPHRDGGQAQFITQPIPQSAGAHRLNVLMDDIRQRLDEPHNLDSLARQAALSRRSFTRQFKALTGTSVLNWLLTQRLLLAQQLLENTDHGIDRVAEMSGFGSSETFRQHFRRKFQLSPRQWRRTFRPVD